MVVVSNPLSTHLQSHSVLITDHFSNTVKIFAIFYIGFLLLSLHCSLSQGFNARELLDFRLHISYHVKALALLGSWSTDIVENLGIQPYKLNISTKVKHMTCDTARHLLQNKDEAGLPISHHSYPPTPPPKNGALALLCVLTTPPPQIHVQSAP